MPAGHGPAVVSNARRPYGEVMSDERERGELSDEPAVTAVMPDTADCDPPAYVHLYVSDDGDHAEMHFAYMGQTIEVVPLYAGAAQAIRSEDDLGHAALEHVRHRMQRAGHALAEHAAGRPWPYPY